jgi:transposase
LGIAKLSPDGCVRGFLLFVWGFKTGNRCGGRLPAFDANLCKQRNVVERCFSRLKQFRDLATRYAKRAAYYQAELTIAAIILWLR